MNYTIRPCETQNELSACVDLQKRVWGYSDRELYPLRLLVTLARIGGHVLGAFTPRSELVAFLASMPAWRDGRRYFHSLSLGVSPEHQSKGLGTALKFSQREAALRAGVVRVEWTFDPLRAGNAFFNIARLGAIVRRYFPDYYGPVKSRLQGGLPSDRLVAEWWLKSLRVKRAVDGKTPWGGKSKPLAEVAIPADLTALLRRDRAQARAAQARVRAQLQRYFSRSLVITGFARDHRGARYLLEHA